MADFVKEHKKNTRFSVNRNERLFLKISEDEKGVWLSLVNALQKRRNTGTQVETFLYLVKKYSKQGPTIKGLKRNARFSVDRTNGVLFKISRMERNVWNEKVIIHGGSQVECFMDMVNAEYTFQDELEIITE